MNGQLADIRSVRQSNSIFPLPTKRQSPYFGNNQGFWRPHISWSIWNKKLKIGLGRTYLLPLQFLNEATLSITLNLLYDGSVLEHRYTSFKMFLLLFQYVRILRDKGKPFSFSMEQGFATLLFLAQRYLLRLCYRNLPKSCFMSYEAFLRLQL